jgi:chaperonin GroES
MKYRPLGARVLIAINNVEEVSSGGIILPDVAKEEKAEGVVMGIGAEVNELEVGDRVIFGKYSGDELELSSKKYRVVNEEDVLAVIEVKK